MNNRIAKWIVISRCSKLTDISYLLFTQDLFQKMRQNFFDSDSFPESSYSFLTSLIRNSWRSFRSSITIRVEFAVFEPPFIGKFVVFFTGVRCVKWEKNSICSALIPAFLRQSLMSNASKKHIYGKKVNPELLVYFLKSHSHVALTKIASSRAFVAATKTAKRKLNQIKVWETYKCWMLFAW